MLFGFSSNQGTDYKDRNQLRDKKTMEGFTNAFTNDSTAVTDSRDAIFTQATNDVSRRLSDLARAQQIAMTETGNFLNVTTNNSHYLDKNVRLKDGTLGYVTKQGVFKRYNNNSDFDATAGKNGCPSNFVPLDTGDRIFTPNGKYLNGDVPLYVGSPMISGQQCGYAGSNIYVNSIDTGNGKSNYLGCKKGDKRTSSGLIATGLKAPTTSPSCPVGTITCPKDGNLCYDPKRDIMSSTYMMSRYDAPPGKLIKGKQNPYLADDGVTYLWRRFNGWYSPCGDKPNYPPCPKGTAPCHSKPGYCYYPKNDIMVTTINPNGKSSESSVIPKFITLVNGPLFTYDEKNNKFTTASPPSDINIKDMQFYIPDKQFTAPMSSNNNKVYEQFKAAAAQLMPHLNIGEKSTIKVISKGNIIRWKTQGAGSIAISGNVNINAGWVFNDITLSNLYDENGNILPKLYIQLRGDTVYLESPKPSKGVDTYKYYFKTAADPLFKGSNSGVSHSIEGAEFTVTKRSDNTADAILKYGPNNMNVSYKFDNALPKYKSHILAEDGNTKLWEVSKGYDNTCGPKPEVPPLIQGDAIMNQCKDIANQGGFSIYGIMDGECYVSKSIQTLQDATNCQSFGSGLMAGTNNSFAAYELEGVKNSGLYRYGYVTADETLREYPNELQRPTERFDSIGRKQITRTPRVKNFAGIGGGVKGCQAKCINEYGNDCEAFNYENSSGNCTVYGLDSIKDGVIIPVGNSELMLRNKELNNHSSCPKNFTNVNTSIWSSLPKDGMMDSNKMCNLGDITKTSRIDQYNAISQVNTSVSNMNTHVQNDVNSNKQLQPKFYNGINTLQTNFNDYNSAYNQ